MKRFKDYRYYRKLGYSRCLAWEMAGKTFS